MRSCMSCSCWARSSFFPSLYISIDSCCCFDIFLKIVMHFSSGSESPAPSCLGPEQGLARQGSDITERGEGGRAGEYKSRSGKLSYKVRSVPQVRWQYFKLSSKIENIKTSPRVKLDNMLVLHTWPQPICYAHGQ